MPATMAGHPGQLQLEQSNMCFALNMAKMAKESFLHATIEVTEYLIEILQVDVCEVMKPGVERSWHTLAKAVMGRHPAMVCGNQSDQYLLWQNRAAQNLQTHWRHTVTSAPPPHQLRQVTAVLIPHLSVMSPVAPGDAVGAQASEIESLGPGYIYIHSSSPRAQCFNLVAYAKNHKHDTDSILDLLNDEETSTD